MDSFYRAGSLVFRGGHIVLSLLQAEDVAPGWQHPESIREADHVLKGQARAPAGPFRMLRTLDWDDPVTEVWSPGCGSCTFTLACPINLELPKPNFWTLPYNFLNKVLLDDPRQSRGVNRLTARLLRA